MEQGGFTASIGADQSHPFLFMEPNTEIIQDLFSAGIGKSDILKIY